MKRSLTFAAFKELRTLSLICLALLLGAALILSTGCDSTPTEVEDYVPEAQLTLFLHNGEPVDKVILHWVGKFNQYYDPDQLGILDANIKLFPVFDADGSVSDTSGRVCYFEDDTVQGGHYLPTSIYIPEGKVRYRIEVVKASEEVNLWAETTVPDTFSFELYQNDMLVDLDGDTLRRGMPDISVRWTPADLAGGYQLGIYALGDRESLVPLDPDWDANDPDDVEAYENEGKYSYTVVPDYQYAITIAWLYFVWSGDTRIDIRACSEEYFDYLFSTFTSGADENPRMNIHGGIGIFGATAVQEFQVYMERVSG